MKNDNKINLAIDESELIGTSLAIRRINDPIIPSERGFWWQPDLLQHVVALSLDLEITRKIKEWIRNSVVSAVEK